MSIRQLFRKYCIDPPADNRVQFLRSLVVGGVATVADMGVLILLKELTPGASAGFWDTTAGTFLATSVGFICGLIVNYLMSTFWAFRGLNTKSRAAEFTVFCIISVIGLALNDLIVWFFDHTLSDLRLFGPLLPGDKYYIAGKIVATLVVFVWNFGLRKILLYRGKKKPQA